MLEKYIKNKLLREVLEWLITIAAAIFIYFVFSNYILQFAKIKGISMQPTFYYGEYVIINRLVYKTNDPELGDIVAFPYQKNKEQIFIKRVVGMPGDEINMVNNSVVVNGEPLNDSFTPEYLTTTGDMDFPITIPDGHYFVMGDNRNASQDSRFSDVGLINVKDMLGRVRIRIYPFDKMGIVA